MAKEPKSLDRWRFELKTIGKKHWLVFYEEMLGTSLSSPQRLYTLLKQYGDWPVFEAILSSSSKTFESDPINYVTKVTHEKWKLTQQEADGDAEYLAEINLAKKESLRKNKELERKLAGGKRKRKPKQ